MGVDLNLATRIYGSSLAAWHLNGRYFDNEGNEIPPEKAALPNPDDPPVVEPPPKVDTVPEYRVQKTVPAAEPAAPAPPARMEASAATRLRKMSSEQVADLVRVAGGKPETGLGSKKRNMAWLLERTQ